jgi:uncharacterized membrane protein YfcA
MNHLKAIIMKFLMIAVVLGIILTGFFNVDLGDTIVTSIVLTIVAYILGDMLIFRKSGAESEYTKRNAIATVCDAILAFALIYMIGSGMFNNQDELFLMSLISALVIAGGEWFFHKYLDRNVYDEYHDAVYD